jgi:predicted PurR-regulated permease PerM
LYFAKPVLLPLVLAILIGFILAPIVNTLQHWGLGRIWAVLGTVILALTLTGLVGWATAVEVQHLAADLPKHKQEIREKIESLRQMQGGVFGDLLEMVRELDDTTTTESGGDAAPVVVAARATPSSMAQIFDMVVPVLEPLAIAALVVVLVIFMLVNREDLRDRIIGLMGHERLPTTTRVFGDTAQRLSQFLLAQLFVNSVFGLVFALIIWLIGVPFALLWGLLTAVLRFVPYIGIWLAAAFPAILAVALFPDWWHAIVLIVCFLVVDLLTANIVEPLLFGHNTGVSPVALLVAAAVWTWIWGPAGLILSTPITVCLVVLGQHVERFHFVTVLLGGQAPVPPRIGFYQRLLAGDALEARERLAEHALKHGLEKTFDEVVVPALALLRRDRQHDLITAHEEQAMYETVRKVLEHLEASHVRSAEQSDAPAQRADAPVLAASIAGSASGDASQSLISPPPSPSRPSESTTPASSRVLGCPAHHISEELILKMIRMLLKQSGVELQAMSSKVLPSDILAAMHAQSPKAVLITVLPPGGLLQAKYLCESLHENFPDVRIVVGYFGAERRFDRVLTRFRRAGASYVTTSVQQSRGQIEHLVREAS